MKTLLAMLVVLSGSGQMAGKDPVPEPASCSGADSARASPQAGLSGTAQIQEHAINTKGTGVAGRGTGSGGDNVVVDAKAAQRDSLQRTGSIVQLRTKADASGESPQAGGTAPAADAQAEKSRHDCALNSIRNIRG